MALVDGKQVKDGTLAIAKFDPTSGTYVPVVLIDGGQAIQMIALLVGIDAKLAKLSNLLPTSI